MESRVTSTGSNGNEGLMISFASLEERGIEFSFMLWGGVLSLMVCGAALFGLEHGASHTPVIHSIFYRNSLPSVAGGKAKSRIVLTCESIESTGRSVVKVTAVVGGDEDGPTPTGRVNFLLGWNSFEIEHLANGFITIDMKLPDNKNLPLRAIYLGDVNYNSAGSFDESPSRSCSRS
ncbi:hypothetical protein RBB79_14970 [Tunturiibacter empetritectus]|uniref:Uncharacterized protein n=1 Tax=Tunturiibacter lichenicola TaxID=2051959 RepID=A0A852VIG9_9BACT|nr:hypothetical protein [Edaphobacter lichenicola]NYF90919.1 hypothetical protein [Edaphobacter lichenicola]